MEFSPSKNLILSIAHVQSVRLRVGRDSYNIANYRVVRKGGKQIRAQVFD